jgi:hypothetical protein
MGTSSWNGIQLATNAPGRRPRGRSSMSREGRRGSLRYLALLLVGPPMNLVRLDPVCNVPALKGVAMVNLFNGHRSAGLFFLTRGVQAIERDRFGICVCVGGNASGQLPMVLFFCFQLHVACVQSSTSGAHTPTLSRPE